MSYVAYKKRPPKRPNLCWTSHFVQFWIIDFGQRQQMSLSKAIYPVLSKDVYPYYVVFKSFRERPKLKKIKFSPDLNNLVIIYFTNELLFSSHVVCPNNFTHDCTIRVIPFTIPRDSKICKRWVIIF